MKITSCITILLSLLSAAYAVQPGPGQPCLASITPDTATFVVTESQPYYNPYPCALSKDSFVVTGTQIDLTISASSNDTGAAYSCAKGWTSQPTGFGFYNCNMKPSGISGTVTSCVAESAVDTPYENVYIKFFGNDTTEVHVGFFTGGRVNQAGPLALNFNPTLAFHSYSFEVTTNYIKWYIDGDERSSEYGSRQLPVQLDHLTVSYVTEEAGVQSENTAYFTSATTGRNFDPALGFTFSTVSFANLTFNPQALSGCDGFNPQPTPDTSNACSVVPAFNIYTDQADNQWTITPLKATLADETSQIHSGAHSLAFTILPDSTLTLAPPAPFVSTSVYALELWINGGSYGNEQIYLSAILDGGSFTAPLSLATLLVGLGGLNAGVWTHTVVPLSALGLSPAFPAQIHGFQMTFPGAAAGGTDAGRTFYLDDIYLIQQYPMCANSTSYIYQDGLAKGVSDQSFNGRYSLTSTSPVYDGDYAISWDMYAYDGLKFHFETPYDTTTWEAISFRINLMGVTNRQWSLYFTSPGSTAENARAGAAPLNLVEYFGGIYPAGTWPLVIIPLREFGIGSGIQIDSIVFACNSNDYQGTLALDNIAFISSQEGHDSSEESSATAVAYTSLFATAAIASLYFL